MTYRMQLALSALRNPEYFVVYRCTLAIDLAYGLKSAAGVVYQDHGVVWC